MNVDKWIKKNHTHTHTHTHTHRILFSLKKGNPLICDNMAELYTK